MEVIIKVNGIVFTLLTHHEFIIFYDWSRIPYKGNI